MKVLKLISQYSTFTHGRSVLCSINRGTLGELGPKRWFCSYREDPELNDFIEYIDALKNYEKMGVPKDAGTDSDDGFDLGRMRRLMDRLGNPQSKLKAVHIAGTKGKGSTAAYLSNILRAEGYHVGCYTSPHILSIRERMSLGRLGEPVSSKALNCLFHRIKQILDEAIVLEDGCLSHFEVLTAVAFTLFAQENVDIAVIEAGLGGARDATNIISSSELATSVITTIGEEHLAALGGSLESIAMAKAGIIKHGRPADPPAPIIGKLAWYMSYKNTKNDISCLQPILLILGGPFLPHIEDILRHIASSMDSSIISASNPGIRTVIKGVSMFKGMPYQSCDIMMKPYEDFQLFIELAGVNLCMLGSHQLQNAVTGVCTALCLRNQGWTISDGSIRAGLEKTCLPGRGQFLTSKESEKLGLQGATVLLDGAHTKESAKALLHTIKMAFPGARLALVVAMASDKDHLGFAKEFLSGGQLEAVFVTEANIAGGKSRTTAAPFLRDCWLQASKELGINVLHDGTAEYGELFQDKVVSSAREFRDELVLAAENSLAVSLDVANQILQERSANRTAHTKESAKALLQTIKMAFPGARLALVVAMASDKDHLGFAKEFLSGGQLEAVFLAEANNAGGKSRTIAASFLRDCWLQASKELGINVLHDRTAEYGELFQDKLVSSAREFRYELVLAAENSLAVSLDVANQILQERSANRAGILVVIGSLHIVSSVLGSLNT